MAKRKRLTPAQPGYLEAHSAELETKSVAFPPSRAPIAQVAGEASAAAALQDLAGEVKRAKGEGRMIQSLRLDQVETGYLTRDRIEAEGDELHELVSSIQARGQRTPIEVVELGGGRYGLISGWRRLTALRRLHESFREDRFATVLAILRKPDTASDAYVAMVEENEIRLGLSYYERARIAAKAVEQGVYATEKEALLHLYSTASRSKRSKIRSFLTLYHAAADLLQFAPAIPERLGLALARALESDPSRRDVLRSALQDAGAAQAAQELACLEAVLKGGKQSLNGMSESDLAATPAPNRPMSKGFDRVAKGIDMSYSGRTLSLTGAGVSEAFRQRLLAWIRSNP